jgi:hypothetical protein
MNAFEFNLSGPRYTHLVIPDDQLFALDCQRILHHQRDQELRIRFRLRRDQSPDAASITSLNR